MTSLSTSQDYGCHRSRHSDTMKIDFRFNPFKSIVDQQSCVYFSSRRVNINVDRFVGIFLDQQHNSPHKFTGRGCCDLSFDEEFAVAQQTTLNRCNGNTIAALNNRVRCTSASFLPYKSVSNTVPLQPVAPHRLIARGSLSLKVLFFISFFSRIIKVQLLLLRGRLPTGFHSL